MRIGSDAACPRLLVVVAHPDDETFGCGSLLAHAADRGAVTRVVCATRGEQGESADGRLTGDELAAAREAELREAAALLAVDQVEILSWRDSGMDGEAAPGTFFAAPPDEVAGAIAAVVDDFEPSVVVTLDGSDGHRDHAHVRDATLLATDQARWRVPRVYVQGLPQRLMRKWVDRLRAEQPDSPYLALGDLGTPDDDITTVIDTSAFLALRERAIAAHATQTSPFEVMPPDVRREFLSRDYLRRVRPVWTGGRREADIFRGDS